MGLSAFLMKQTRKESSMRQRQRFIHESGGTEANDPSDSRELVTRRQEAQDAAQDISALIDRVLSTNSRSFLEAARQQGGQ
jgi:hypothetical protein